MPGSNEWMTPPEFLKLVREFYNGSIGLDPASNAVAQEYVQAREYYSIQEGRDGLELAWNAKTVFCNPPYSSDLVKRFADKVLHEVEHAPGMQVVLLVNSSTDTQWYHKLAARADALLLWRGRLKFWKIQNEVAHSTWYMSDTAKLGNSPRYLNSVFYFGGNVEKFTEIFGAYGTILRKVD